jgi:exopolysaccharide biosynthesis polyprenyl glycosylphosphotransferase
MIARRIWVLIDACLIFITFALARALTPLLWPARHAASSLLVQTFPSYAGYFLPGPDEIASFSRLSGILLVVMPAVLFALLAIDAYDRLHDISRTRMLLSGPFAALMGMTVVALVAFLSRTPDWSRVFLFTFTILMALALTSVRVVIRSYHHWQAKAGYYKRNLLLAGPAETMQKVVESIGPLWPVSDLNVIGYLEAPDSIMVADQRMAEAVRRPAMVGVRAGAAVKLQVSIAGAGIGNSLASATTPRRLAGVTEIEAILLHHPVHEVVTVARTDSSLSWVNDIIRACDHAGISFRLVPEVLLAGSFTNLVAKEGLSGLGRELPSIALTPRVLDADALYVKRVIDLVLSVAGLVVLSPVFLFVALLIRLTGPGPIFHSSKLVGQNGKPFVAWKFRTMVPNASAMMTALKARNEMTGPVFKIKNDPRITKVGRWLRKFSLDELPQLYSVLKGDQSLVGPRAASSHEFERYEFWQMRKISVKPGLTCFWQVRGRNAISNFDDWIKMDLEYIDNWSLWLDFKILMRTVVVVIKGTGY